MTIVGGIFFLFRLPPSQVRVAVVFVSLSISEVARLVGVVVVVVVYCSQETCFLHSFCSHHLAASSKSSNEGRSLFRLNYNALAKL